MSRALPKTKIWFPENLRSRALERSECVESGGKINTGSIGWWSGGWKGVAVANQAPHKTEGLPRRLCCEDSGGFPNYGSENRGGVFSPVGLELGRGGLFPGQNKANTNIYCYCHLNNKPFRYGYHNVILNPSPLTVRSRSGSRVLVVKSEALYYPRWGRGIQSTVKPPLMNRP